MTRVLWMPVDLWFSLDQEGRQAFRDLEEQIPDLQLRVGSGSKEPAAVMN